MRRCTHSVARQNQDLRDETDIVTLDVITIFENDDSWHKRKINQK